MRYLGRDQQSDDGSFPKRFARFQPMKPLDQNEAVFVGPNKNWSLLSDFQNTLGDLLNQFRLESFPPLHGNVDLVDWEAFRFGHSFYSVSRPSPIQSATRHLQWLREAEPALGGRNGGTKPYSNNVQLRTASVTIQSSYGTRKRTWRPSSVLRIAGPFTAPLHRVGLALSVVGTNPTCRGGLTMSVDRGRPEGAVRRPK